MSSGEGRRDGDNCEWNGGTQGQAADEFRNLSLDLIVVEGQVRTGIDMEDESFQGFMASIAEKGVIEPVIVTPRGDKFLLMAGERRFLVCRKLGLAKIPARILPNVQSGEEILAIRRGWKTSMGQLLSQSSNGQAYP